MCPFCIATVAVLAVKAASVGGVGAIVVGKIVKRREAKQVSEQVKVKEKGQ
jgi:hypothetical protein